VHHVEGDEAYLYATKLKHKTYRKDDKVGASQLSVFATSNGKKKFRKMDKVDPVDICNYHKSTEL